MNKKAWLNDHELMIHLLLISILIVVNELVKLDEVQ